MEKPMYEILSNDIEMVEDMIDALMIVPKGYKLHPMGNKCALAVDHIHECVYADEEMWINDYEYEIVSEAKEMALPVETDVPDESLQHTQTRNYMLLLAMMMCVGMVIMRQFFMGCTVRSNLQEKLRRNFLNWGIYIIMK